MLNFMLPLLLACYFFVCVSFQFFQSALFLSSPFFLLFMMRYHHKKKNNNKKWKDNRTISKKALHLVYMHT